MIDRIAFARAAAQVAEMAEDAGEDAPTRHTSQRTGHRAGWWGAAVLLLLVVAALAGIWLSRERIASDVIAEALTERGIEARYEIVSIGPDSAVLRDIVIGDPARPDLTVERATVNVRHRFGFPVLDEVLLVRPRLYGSWREGRFSFGALDPLIFTDGDEPFELPDLSLGIEDGGALIETDYGRVGLSLTGSGWLRGGFRGELAAAAPRLALGGCAVERPTLYGMVAITNAQPDFAGPLRLAQLACPQSGVALAGSTLQLQLGADRRLAVIDGRAALELGAAAMGGASLARTTGDLVFTWRDTGLVARYDLAGTGLVSPQAGFRRVALEGSLRAMRDFERIELDAGVRAEDLRLGDGLDRALASAAGATEETLLAPLLRQVRATLAQRLPGSTLAGELIARRTGERLSLVVPGARLQTGGGETLLALSRFQLASEGAERPSFAGNFATGGALPRIAARLEREGGGTTLTASMAPYAAGSSRLAIPRLTGRLAADGSLTFAGEVAATGPLPGGRAQGLELPVSGSWSDAGLVLWRECTELRFEQLRYANLTLDGRRLTLCPPRGRPMVRSGPQGLEIAAGAPSLRLSGMLGGTPIVLDSGPVGFAVPGVLTAQRLNVALGPADTATRFAVTDLTARIGDEIAGSFAGTDVLLYSVPLDLRDATGEWRYAGGRFTIEGGSFRLEDRRVEAPRFNPMIARDGVLVLEDNRITGEAVLREPVSDRVVAQVALAHDLTTGTGGADLAVEGLRFDRDLQPVALSPLALGLVANVDGVIDGSGRIDWNAEALTSTGSFSSNDLDFAAAFGPVEGASGTIRFTDLIGLTTAPGQEIRVRSVNPGIAVDEGVIRLQLRGGEVLAVESGSWPFMGGTLTIRPIELNLGVEEVRAYVFEIRGLEAALFVQRMEVSNLSASGTFDGTIPIVFDNDGNGSLVGGVLVSRPPGGNLAYVGELTYEDLSTMANFAFDSLRSLDYREMRIQMDGSLTGEIVTRVQFEGVSQGEGTRSNIITRRLARLPIRFLVNIRAPFYTLLGSMRSLYDPEAIRDPRELGLIDGEGNAIRQQVENPPPPDTAEDLLEKLIQPPESEQQP